MSFRLLRHHSYLLAGLFGFWGGVVAWVVGEPVWYHGRQLLASIAPLRAVLGDSPDVPFAATLGLYLGIFLGAVEGILALRMTTLARGMVAGGIAGMAGGCVGSLLGESAFRLLGGSQVGRALGWAVFGALLGVAPGMALKAIDRAARGFLGGAVGGFVGGMLFFLVAALFHNPVVGRMAAIPLLGAILGVCYGLAQTLMRHAWLTVLSGRNEGYEFAIGGRPVTIGSGSRADLALVGDPPLPGLAVRLIPRDDGVHLERLDIDRVLVNQEAADGCRLKDGDVIRIRGVRILFSNRDGSAGREPAPAPTVVNAPSQAPGAPSSPIAPVTSKKAAKWVLMGLTAPVEGKRFVLEKDQFSIGRDDGNDVVVDDLSVSLRHAEIVRKGTLWVVFDLGSSNGTFVQGRRTQENALKSGFSLDVGQVKFRFEEQ